MAVTYNYCHTILIQYEIKNYLFSRKRAQGSGQCSFAPKRIQRPSFFHFAHSQVCLSIRKKKGEAIKHTKNVWSKYQTSVDLAFKELGIKDPGDMTCFLHGMSCEGWFDTDDNSIHVRFPESGGDKNLLDTIIHEILHLATYDDKYDYGEREEIVDKILAKPQFKNC